MTINDAGGEAIIFSNGVAIGTRLKKGVQRERKEEGCETVKNKNLPGVKNNNNNRGKRCGLPLGPSSAANPAATAPVRGPHLARGRTGPVQQRRLFIRLPSASKQRRRLLIIPISAGPRHLLGDVGHGPLRTKLNKNSLPSLRQRSRDARPGLT